MGEQRLGVRQPYHRVNVRILGLVRVGRRREKDLVLSTEEEGKNARDLDEGRNRFYTSETLMVTCVAGVAEEPLLPGREFRSLWVSSKSV